MATSPLFVFAAALAALTALTALTANALPSLDNYERKLYEDLLVKRTVETNVRPVNDSENVVKVEMGIYLIQIVGLDEEKNCIELNSWLKMSWQDANFVWDPSQYGGLDNIHVDPTKLWNPDIMLYNTAAPRDEVTYNTLTIAYHNGNVLWVPPADIQATCSVDLRRFPYDEQHCSVKFGSWTYHNRLIALELGDKTYEKYFMENSEWKLEGITAEKHSTVYPCCPDEEYDDVEFTLHLVRRSSYLQFTLVVPSIVTAVLVLVLFYLPPSASERLQLGSSVAVFQLIHLVNIYWEVPHNSGSTPVLVVFNGVSMAFVALAVAASAFLWRMTRHGDRGPVPPIVRMLTGAKVGRILCLQTKNVGCPEAKEDGGPLSKQGDQDWFVVALVLNRIFFVVFLFVYFVLLATAFV